MRSLATATLFMCTFIACDVVDGTDPALPAEVDEVVFDSVLHGPEVESLFERTRRAFTARDGELFGGDATAGTQVSHAGIAVTPYQWPDDTRSVAGAALRLRTASIARGSDELAAAAAPAVSLAASGAAEIDHGGAVEQVRNTAGGLEQSWDFAAAPAGDGDLVVRIAVTGQDYAGRTDAGLHFADPASGLGFSYSDATWIDAEGERTPVPAVFDGSAIVLTVPHDVVQASAYPARLDPTVAAEHGLDNPILGPAAEEQRRPDIAYSGVAGAEFLVVWIDHRRSGPLHDEHDVFGARVNAAGQVLDPIGIHIPSTNVASGQNLPRVAWGDDGPGGLPGHWFVVWDGVGHIRGIKIDATGKWLGPDFAVSPPDDSTTEGEPDIAFNPMSGGNTGRFLVVWGQSTAGGSSGVGARTFRPDSPAGGAEFTTFLPDQRFHFNPGVSAGPASTGFFVVWLDSVAGNHTIFGATVSATAAPGPIQVITSHPFADSHLDPAIGFAPGAGWLVTWKDEEPPGTFTGDIRGQLVSLAGVPTGPNFPIATGSQFQAHAKVEGGIGPFASRFLVIFGDGRASGPGLYGARVDVLAGVPRVLDPAGIPISVGPSSGETLIYNAAAQNFMVAWTDGRNSREPDIYGARVRASTGVVLDPNGKRFSGSFNQQTDPAIATCGGKYLAVWTDTRNGFDTPDIYGSLTDASTPVNILRRNIPIAVAPGRQGLPDVACNGTDFFVVWADERNVEAEPDIFGTRVRASNGAVLDPAGIPIASVQDIQTDPAIAYLGTSGVYQVVWSDNRNGSDHDIFGKRVSSAGVVNPTSEVNISGPVANDQRHPDVTWDTDFSGTLTNRFLVVWEDGRNRTSPSDQNWDIFGRFIDVGGTLWSTIAIDTSANAQSRPSVATRPNVRALLGRQHFVVYQSAFWSQWDVWGTVVFPNSTIGGLEVISNTTFGFDEIEPAIANRTGDAMVVTYSSRRIGEEFDHDVHARDIDIDPLDPLGDPVVVSAAPAVVNHPVRELAPAVNCVSPTSCQVVYQRYSDKERENAPPVDAPGVDRVRGRMLTY
jgi:hypothetical protein